MWKRFPTFCGNGLIQNVETLSYVLWKRVSTICRNAEPHFAKTPPKKNADRSASASFLSACLLIFYLNFATRPKGWIRTSSCRMCSIELIIGRATITLPTGKSRRNRSATAATFFNLLI